MSITFENTEYFSAIKEKNFNSEKEIFKYAKAHVQFAYGEAAYEKFSEKYSTNGWFGRKVAALPLAIWSALVKTVYHLAGAIFIGIPKAVSDKGKHLQASLFYVVRDFQESFGWLTSLFHDRYGKYHVQASYFQKTCYDCFSTSKLLDSVIAENSARDFKEEIEKVEKIDLRSWLDISKKCNKRSWFVSPLFNPIRGEEPQFLINDRLLSEDQIVDLLLSAYKKGIVLHLKSLQFSSSNFETTTTQWMEAGIFQEEIEDVKKSFNISAEFIKECYDQAVLNEDSLDAKKVNKQLTALSVKYFDLRGGIRSVHPSLFFESPNRVKLNSIYGELGDLGELLKKISFPGLEIEITGFGFRLWAKCARDKNGWKKHIEKFTNTTRFNANIHDQTDAQLDTWQQIWQNAIPPKVYTPTFNDIGKGFKDIVLENSVQNNL